MSVALVARNDEKVRAQRKSGRQVPTTDLTHRAIDQEHGVPNPSLPHDGDRVPFDVSGYIALAWPTSREGPPRHPRDAATMGSAPGTPIDAALDESWTRPRDHQGPDRFRVPDEKAPRVIDETLLE